MAMREIPLGRIAGIPISASWSVIGIAAFVVYSLAFDILPRLFATAPLIDRLFAASMCAALFVLSILGHELGHAFLAKRHGIAVDGISLWILGGVAKLSRQAQTPKAEFEIAAAGPLVSLLIGLVFSTTAIGARRFGILGPGPAVLAWLGIVNVLIAGSNLLPASPLDGGRVLTAALWKKIGDAETARLYSARSGILTGLSLLLGGLGALIFLDLRRVPLISAVVMGIFLIGAARNEAIGAAVRRRLNHTDVQSIMTPYPSTVPAQTPLDRFAVWAGQDQHNIVYPVVRWGHEPVGYLTPAWGSSLSPAERSWTRVNDVMIPAESVPRAWNSESADTVLRRMERSHPIAVVHNVRDNQMIGTVSQAQLHRLIERSDWWGRMPPIKPSTLSENPGLASIGG